CRRTDAWTYRRWAGAPAGDPRVAFLGAESKPKVGHRAEAGPAYAQLGARGADDPWHDIGRSAVAVLGPTPGEAVEAASQAAAHGDALAEAHFQRGLALSVAQDMAAAAAAFERATELDPSWADAH